MSSDDAVYPIRTVAELTGVNPVTLRAWERRYGLIRPRRTAKGHRLYSEADIERIRRIVELLDRGVLISRAREILAADAPEDALTEAETDPWPAWRRRLDRTLQRFDPAALDGALGELLSLYPIDRAAAHVLLPALSARLERADDPDAVAEGHLLAAYLRGRLGHMVHRSQPVAEEPLVIAAPPGAGEAGGVTETALTVLALSALTAGIKPVLLGADVPPPAIGAALRRSRARMALVRGGPVPEPGWTEALAEAAASSEAGIAITGPAAEGTWQPPAGIRRLPGAPHEVVARVLDQRAAGS